MWLFWLILALLLIFLIATLICYKMAYYVPRRDPKKLEEFSLPEGKIYLPYKDQMFEWMKEVRAMPHQAFSIRSFDGLELRGKYYEYAPDAPIELMFHGYRGSAERDLCGGVQRCFALGHSALIVDQRAAGRSEGHTISFGINESRDCLSWVDFMVEHFGKDAKIILCGISMGASTVLIAAGEPLPQQVIGVLADCGYHSAKEIIMKVIGQLHLPAKLIYPIVRLAAKLYGRFDPEEITPEQAMKKCSLPVIFFHGDDDRFVPYEMSIKNYEACAGPKKLVLTKDAGHGLCYLKDQEGYLQAVRDFENQYWK